LSGETNIGGGQVNTRASSSTEDEIPDMVTAAETGIPERTLLGFIYSDNLNNILGGVDKNGTLWITNDWRLAALKERLLALKQKQCTLGTTE
jgi:hypothetical protein